MYRDDQIGKRFPAVFSLINNIKKEGYKFLLNKILNYIIIDNNINKKLQTLTIDFEESLIEAWKTVFPKIRIIGCYYHYCRNIREKVHSLQLITILHNDIQNETNRLFNDLNLMPFKYNQNPCILDAIEKELFNKLQTNFTKKNFKEKDSKIIEK